MSSSTYTFAYKASNQRITVQVNSQGKIACYCSDPGCPSDKRVYKTVENLKKHMGKVGSHWIGPRVDSHPPQPLDEPVSLCNDLAYAYTNASY